MLTERKMNVHLYVTPICNLRCRHCYYEARLADYAPAHLIGIEQIAQIVMTLSDEYDVFFDIEGGEFFLRDDIMELLKAMPDRYWSRVTITTNGTIEIKGSFETLKLLDEFRVSVEGHTDDLQEELRGIPLGPVLRTCAILRSEGVPITLRTTLHKKNHRYVTEMIGHFVNLGFTRFSMYEFQSVGRGADCNNTYALDESDLYAVLEQLSSIPAMVDGLELVKLSLNARRLPLIHNYKRNLEACGYEIVELPETPSLVIDYDGRLAVCPWSLTSRTIGYFHAETFLSDIRHFYEIGALDHTGCSHCSAIRVVHHRRAG